MKTERRHELETNQLADSLGHWADAVRPYVNSILVAVLAVVVGAAVYAVAQRRTATETAAAWDDYFAALARLDRNKLEDLGEAHGGTPVGWWSLCMAADLGLRDGSDQLFHDSVLARDILRTAADHYQQVLGETHEPALLKQASFGLARVHECLGEIKKAEAEYQAISARWHDTPFALAADKRAKDLKRPEIREFYDWFAKQDIGKRNSPRLGTPNLQIPFNFDNLPALPEKSGTSPGENAAPGSSETPDGPGETTSEATTDGPAAGAEATGTESAGTDSTGTDSTGKNDAERK